MSIEGDAAVRSIAVLLPPGVYGATPAVPDKSNISTTSAAAPVGMDSLQGSSAVLASSSVDRFDKHRRLRRAMAAKEATLMELTRLLVNSMEPQQRVKGSSNSNSSGEPANTAGGGSEKESHGEMDKTVNTTSTPAPIHTSTEAEVKYLREENKRLRIREATRAKEQAKLESLVYDLRRELETAGETLRDQTAAMKCVGKEVARMGPYRMIKTQREQQVKYVPPETLEEKSSVVDSSELQSLKEKVKSLQSNLAKEQKRREHFERRCAELQAISLRYKLTELRRTVEGDNEENVDISLQGATVNDNDNDGNSIASASTAAGGGEEEERRISRKGKVTESLEKPVSSNGDGVMKTIQSIEETYRSARRRWSRQEKEFKRYMQILESTISRMERNMPSGKLNTASLFNVTLQLVSCEGLLNRRNNGIGCIDPYVVLYSPIGEKALETLPREDTVSPQFDEGGDVVTLKMVQGSPWYVLVEVYSRGLNNVRLFLGEAKIPVELLLSDGVIMGKERQHVVKLRPRDREPDGEIVKSAHRLGQVVFRVTATVVDAIPLHRISRRAVRFSGRLISPQQDGEVPGSAEYLSEKIKNYNPPLLVPSNNTITIRVVKAKDILKGESGMNFNPFVVIYDLSGSKELLRTPVAVGTNNPSWDNSIQASLTLTTGTLQEGIIFRLNNYNRDGKEEFLGEAYFSREEMYSGKEWHELTLRPRKDEMLMYIRENQNRLGKLLIQCIQENKGNKNILQNKELHSTIEPIRKILGHTESSKIVQDESSTNYSKNVLQPLPIQIYVEACKGLHGYYREGKVYVRVVVPNSTSFITPVLPCISTLSWSKAEGSTVAMLHPLQSGVIEFHVIEKGNQEGENERPLGYAQFSVLDLFRGGFGKKELLLTASPHTTEIPVCENSNNLGSVVISFLLLSEEPLTGSPRQVCAATNDSNENNRKKEEEKKKEEKNEKPEKKKDENEEEEKEEEKTISKGTLGDPQVPSSPTSLQMRIYVKEGHDLLDCDHSMFNVLGLTNPRVMVWVGPDHVFTVSEKPNTVNPKWTQEEGEVLVCAQSSQIIRFEVQDVDVAGFDSMGCATIHASEIIASPGEHSLPVILDGKQYGILDVVFTLNESGTNQN
ncbi:uncharacterized protein TM35_000024500 [Trypanosoma theileri]|uniref:C2 domain-containing protein n=1 Tax=Trypanosoma theileri TaxID=67003 RepID=A0A1X0P875_9TRYP|nr:uncharacterized protein TM35_000024500 [Trypanosoma theileri]ORC93124.1 hypothetical protein TM35_000024500 [Trypanosoma theileri]